MRMKDSSSLRVIHVRRISRPCRGGNKRKRQVTDFFATHRRIVEGRAALSLSAEEDAFIVKGLNMDREAKRLWRRRATRGRGNDRAIILASSGRQNGAGLGASGHRSSMGFGTHLGHKRDTFRTQFFATVLGVGVVLLAKNVRYEKPIMKNEPIAERRSK